MLILMLMLIYVNVNAGFGFALLDFVKDMHLMLDWIVAEYYTPEISLFISVENDGFHPDEYLMHEVMLTHVVEEWIQCCNQFMDNHCHCNDIAELDILNCKQHYHLIRTIGSTKDNWEAHKHDMVFIKTLFDANHMSVMVLGSAQLQNGQRL